MQRVPFRQSDRFLCHYTSRYAALAHILPRGWMRLSPFGRMRDPLEAKDVYVGVVPPPSMALPATYETLHHDLNTNVNRVLKREFKLLSMTADDTPSPGGAFPVGDGHFGRCYARPRMWEQYAEGHRGLCLLFDYDQLIDTVSGALAGYGWHRHGSVTYRPMSEGLRDDIQVPWERIQRLPMDDLVEELIDERAPASFFDKFDDYASEQEYRFVVRAPRDDYLQIPFGSALRGVALGAEFPAAELTPLFFMCAELGAALLRVEWRQGLGQIAGFYNPTIPFEHNHAPEVQPHRDELVRWHPTLVEYATPAHAGA